MRIINNHMLLIIKFFQIFNKIFKPLLVFLPPHHKHTGTHLVLGIGKGEQLQAVPIIVIKLLKTNVDPFICDQSQFQAVDILIKTGFLQHMLLF